MLSSVSCSFDMFGVAFIKRYTSKQLPVRSGCDGSGVMLGWVTFSSSFSVSYLSMSKKYVTVEDTMFDWKSTVLFL